MNYSLLRFIDSVVGIPLVFALSLASRKRSAQGPDSGVRTIMLIKFAMMGDTVLLIPALRALRNAYPRARIIALVSDINSAVLCQCPYIDETRVVRLGALINPLAVLGLIRWMRSCAADIAIDFEQWFRFSALLAYFSGARRTVGFKTAGQYRHFLFDPEVAHADQRHEVECFFDILLALGIPGGDKRLELPVIPAAAEELDGVLARHGIAGNRPLIIIHPGSSRWRQKQWPQENYAELIKALKKDLDADIILTGSKSEHMLVDAIITAAPGKGIYSLCGELSLHALTSLLRKARLVVCGNTGVMHLAAAAGTAVVVINGPVSDVKWGPWSTTGITVNTSAPCAPCVYLGFEYRCSSDRCMRAVKVKDVEYAVKNAFSDGTIRRQP